MATIRVYLHDVSLMLVRVEVAHGGEGGAPGQHTWHTQCPFLINCNSFAAFSNENRTRPYLTRAIYFPTEGKKPEFVWMQIMYHKHEFDEWKDTMDIGISNLQPEDRGLKYVNVQWVEYNEVLKRSHQRIQLLGVLGPPGENGKGMLIGKSKRKAP
jgi:hypothetical protein